MLFARIQLFAACVLTGLVFSSPALATPFDCAHNHCGLLTQGTTPDLVVGTVEAVATPEQMKAVFQWAHAHGYWKSLPADGHGLDFIQLVSLSVPTASGGRSVTVLMTREEFEASPLKPGALVRYSPHDAAHDAITYKDPAKQSYWALVGCVAQLCAAEDAGCSGRYQQGRFSRHAGAQLQLRSGKPIPHGAVINTDTLLPKVQSKPGA